MRALPTASISHLANTHSRSRGRGPLGQLEVPPAEVRFEVPRGPFQHPLVHVAAGVAIALLAAVGGYALRRERVNANALRRRETHYRSLLENTNDLVTLVDERGVVRYQNQAIDRLVGRPAEAAVGRSLAELLPSIDRSTLDSLLAAGDTAALKTAELHLQLGDACRILETSARAMRTEDGTDAVVLTSRDVTERVRAEDERRRIDEGLRRTQKLESLGLMAGGVAHDFNNLLVAIIGHADLALLEPGVPAPVERSMRRILTAAQRASELTNQLLAYSGHRDASHERIQLDMIVHELRELLAITARKHADLSYDLVSGLPSVVGDPSQLRQVVMNLITNAVESGNGDRVRVTVQTSLRSVAGAPPREHEPELHTGHYVSLAVSDDGAGMDEATMERIFDPFFTTKATGRGLGLAASHGIVRAHGGTIRVHSRPGAGSRFELLLPVEPSPTLGDDAMTAQRPAARGSVLVDAADPGASPPDA